MTFVSGKPEMNFKCSFLHVGDCHTNDYGKLCFSIFLDILVAPSGSQWIIQVEKKKELHNSLILSDGYFVDILLAIFVVV